MATTDVECAHVQVKLFTKEEKHAVPSNPLSIPSTVQVKELSDLINSLLEKTEGETIDFDFLIGDEFLRVSLQKFIEEHNLSTEDVLEIEYVESEPAPEPHESLPHEDWVSCIHSIKYSKSGSRILSGSYDNTIKLWSTTGKALAMIPGHSGPVKSISWIQSNSKESSFVSGSHDQTLIIWRWDEDEKTVKPVCVCKGHSASVDCVAVDSTAQRLASGSSDALIKIWSAGTITAFDTDDDGQHKNKKMRNEEKLLTRVPLMTLSGHKEAVSSCDWINDNELLSVSWDHTIKLWDLNNGQEKSCLQGNKVFLDSSYSKLNQLILTSSSDRHVRIWDSRAKEGAVVKCTYTSHTGWVTGVCWSPNDDNHFISGSYDMALKLWDSRSPKVPLYNMTGHDDRILCVDWSIPDLMMSGGADNALKIFKR